MEAALAPDDAGTGRRTLVFTGFMGAGKTLAARSAARALGVCAVDSDDVLAERSGMPIERFFDERGEVAFRAEEEACVLALLQGADGAVLALGGGAVGSARVQEALRAHRVVWLDVDIEEAWQRARGTGRPLAREHSAFAALHAAREPLYERLADATVPSALAPDIERVLPALLALDRAAPGTRLLYARSASGEYPVYVGAGLLRSGFWPPAPIDGMAPPRRFLVTDRNVARLWAGALGDVAGLIELEAGEEHKTVGGAERAWRALARAGMTRDDQVVALGGGVVGDLAGFCAATYQRGMAVVQVPTTLVGQVDSAYGGKTGVDLPEGKNYVGAYHQPVAVLVDPDTLGTLPASERAAGFAEVVKTALVAGGPLWERVRAGAEPDAAMILACARTKLAVVGQDERDEGRRQVLNLGHTVGHAIETATAYRRYRHGEAVGLGLLSALRLSGQDGLRDEVAALLAARGLPTRLHDVAAQDVVAATARDKKRRTGAAVPFVLLDAPGAPRPGCVVAPDDLAGAVAELVA